ncbi:MAG TPA: AmmeMemoRadiSam system protein A [Acidobacteriota bacterium]|nr:AmmeMemoRadiSam system protein A [Acidobacteriota bacterium]
MRDTDRAELLKLARTTLEIYLKNGKIPAYQTSSEELLEQKGAFVSLHHRGELRGCIGQLIADRELYKIVQHCVLSAALEDTRFISVTPDEVNGLSIEISVLTPFRRIQDANEIEVGRHGLYMVRGGYRGLLLPQVATQYHWDRIQFLEHTCIKSGLPENSWRDPQTVIYTFEAEVFSDESVNLQT